MTRQILWRSIVILFHKELVLILRQVLNNGRHLVSQQQYGILVHSGMSHKRRHLHEQSQQMFRTIE